MRRRSFAKFHGNSAVVSRHPLPPPPPSPPPLSLPNPPPSPRKSAREFRREDGTELRSWRELCVDPRRRGNPRPTLAEFRNCRGQIDGKLQQDLRRGGTAQLK